MKKLLFISIILLLVNCGIISKGVAKYTGYDSICIDNVLYYQFSSGATVAYNMDGTIKRCN